MKNWLISMALALASPAFAASTDTIPAREPDFVTTVQSLNQDEIAELLGAPAYQYDIRNDEGDVVGAIWHYHHVTAADDGQYYKTTELDFVGGRVVTVVLINTDDSSADNDAEPVSLPSEPGPGNTF
ncbi:MAG TPA: hypothetical protein VGK14_07845 [Novimethylophilus sp.]|jgi:hypothetical protein|uniref:hypothetical protein n=1 Tax=Novimethylophilus sp. TaxID=2137426 RepID=UPI002F3E6C27